MAKEHRDWHRLFGMILTDFFSGSPFRVELEKDLSLKKQLLDVVILRREAGAFAGRLPDRLEDLARHKLKELTGHYVNYRKQVSPFADDLLAEEEFRLFAVCARYPQGLDEHAGKPLVRAVPKGGSCDALYDGRLPP